MESLPVTNPISAATITTHHHGGFLVRPPIRLSTAAASVGRHFRFLPSAKKSLFQDFQNYAKPLRLFPARKPEVCTDSSLEKLLRSLNVEDESECLYQVKLHTSNSYGSGLSDLSAGVLLCLIDENGDSILQKIEAVDKILPDVFHFQRGSVDEFIFGGPKLGRIEALWISLESGQWRIGDVSLSITCRYDPALAENDKKKFQFYGVEYSFNIDDTLIGEGSDSSMVEFRPCLLQESCGDSLTMLRDDFEELASVATRRKSREESMRDYADLKLSLLLYDALLVVLGSSVAYTCFSENAGIAYLSGGLGGFCYLVLLQRSIDGLPTPASASLNTINRNGVLLPAALVLLASTFAVVAVKYGGWEDGPVTITPQEVISGMLGFLTCKVSVLLAAFKPVQIRIGGENK